MMHALWLAWRAWRGPRSRADDDWWPWYEDVYLRSPQWRIRRRIVLWLHFNRCSVCGKRATEVHHKTYEHVGHERLGELQAACDACHDFLDRQRPRKGRRKR